MMRYQIADGILDLIHIFWLGFLVAPIGTFTMGGAAIFAPLRERYPSGVLALLMFVLAVFPYHAIRRQWLRPYVLSRVVSAMFFTYLSWLCVVARPISTGAIYSALALGAALLAFAALQHSNRGAV